MEEFEGNENLGFSSISEFGLLKKGHCLVGGQQLQQT